MNIWEYMPECYLFVYIYIYIYIYIYLLYTCVNMSGCKTGLTR